MIGEIEPRANNQTVHGAAQFACRDAGSILAPVALMPIMQQPTIENSSFS
jgi:hypothetical protein